MVVIDVEVYGVAAQPIDILINGPDAVVPESFLQIVLSRNRWIASGSVLVDALGQTFKFRIGVWMDKKWH